MSQKFYGPNAQNVHKEQTNSIKEIEKNGLLFPDLALNQILDEMDMPRYGESVEQWAARKYSLLPAEKKRVVSQKMTLKLHSLIAKKLNMGKKNNKQLNQQSQPLKSRRAQRISVTALGLTSLILGAIGIPAAAKSIIRGVDRNAEKNYSYANDYEVPAESETTGFIEKKQDGIAPNPDNEIVHNIGNGQSTSGGESGDFTAQHENDRVSYVFDISDYYHPTQRKNIFEFMERGLIDGLCVEIAKTEENYPFRVSTLKDDRIGQNIDSSTILIDRFGEPELLTSIMEKSPVTIPYMYTGAMDYKEAEEEATIVANTMKLLREDMQDDYDFNKRVGPLAIDIESCGELRIPSWSSDKETEKIRIAKTKQRTDAIIHLIDELKNKGIIDQRGLIVYGGLGRMAEGSQVDWNKLFKSIEDRGIRYYIWATEYLENHMGKNYRACENVDDFAELLLNSEENVDIMKQQYHPYRSLFDKVALQQIHGNQTIRTNVGYMEAYDINITTYNTLCAIVNGRDLNPHENLIAQLIQLVPSYQQNGKWKLLPNATNNSYSIIDENEVR